MTGVNRNDPKLLNPDARSSVKLTTITASDGGIARGGQQIIHEHPERPINYSPLRGADILKEPRVSHRRSRQASSTSRDARSAAPAM